MIMFCGNCGAEGQSGSGHCAVCGVAFGQAQAPAASPDMSFPKAESNVRGADVRSTDVRGAEIKPQPSIQAKTQQARPAYTGPAQTQSNYQYTQPVNLLQAAQCNVLPLEKANVGLSVMAWFFPWLAFILVHFVWGNRNHNSPKYRQMQFVASISTAVSIAIFFIPPVLIMIIANMFSVIFRY